MKRKLTHNLASQSVSQSVSQGNCNLADSLLSSWAVEL
jgi:hypothetical protein